MNNNTDKLLTIEEVSNVLRVSTRSINRYTKANRLKASKIGVWGIKQLDLNNFLSETSNIK